MIHRPLLSFHKCIKVNKLSIALLLAFAASVNAFSQDSDPQGQFWFDFNPHFYLNEKLESFGDWGYRTNFDDAKWRRIHGRPSLRYHHSDLIHFHAGLGMFYTFNQGENDRFELTPWQGVKLNWPSFGRLRFDHLGRVEERFSKIKSDESGQFSARFRYRINGKYKLSESETPWFLQGQWEGFYPMGDDIDERFRNRNRFVFGFGKTVSNDWTYTLLFNYQENRSSSEAEFEADNYALQLKIKKIIHGPK